MLRCWSIKHSFISSILPYSNNYLNNIFSSQKIFNQIQQNNFKLFQIDRQISTLYNDYYKSNNLSFNLNITEQNHLYPKPYSLVSSNFIHYNLDISTDNTNITEIFNIKFNHPEDFSINAHYLLTVNNNITRKIVFSGFPNYKFYNSLKHDKHTLKLLNSISNKIDVKPL